MHACIYVYILYGIIIIIIMMSIPHHVLEKQLKCLYSCFLVRVYVIAHV